VVVLGLGWFPDQAGGLNRYARELLRQYGAVSTAVVIGPVSNPPPNVTAVSRHDAPLLERIARFTIAARRAARGARVVDVHFALYAAVPILLGIARRRTLVVHFQGPWADEAVHAGSTSRAARVARRAVERFVYRRADVLVVLSQAFADILAEQYGVERRRIHVLPGGVHVDQFVPVERAVARAGLGIDADAFVVAVVRRLIPRTGVDTLVDAAAEMGADDGAPASRRVEVLVVGSGPESSSLERRAAKLGARVRFLGSLTDDDVVAVYGAADVAAVPSRAFEGFGLVVLEALSCGVPALVADVGGLPEVVGPLDPDLVLPREAPAAWAARIAEYASGTRSLPSAEACRTYASTRSWDAIGAAHRALYEELGVFEREGRRRVVFVDHTASRSGGEIALVRLIQALHDVDAHVILFEEGPIVEDLRAVGATVEVLEMPEATRRLPRSRASVFGAPFPALVGAAATTRRLARRLRRLRPDVVHANSLKAGVVASLAARAAHTPLVWYLHDRLTPDYLPAPVARLVRIMANRLASAVVTNSESTRAASGIDRAVVIPCPYDPPANPPVRSTRPNLDVVMVGRLAPWKGQREFLEAFALAFPDSDARGALIGSPMFGEESYARELESRVSELGLEDRMELTGFVDDVPARLAAADIAVHASVLAEPHGQVVVEAMAAGLAVIASDAGGPAEIITKDVDGLLVPAGDIVALAAALQRLGEDPELRAKLGDAARTRAAAYRGAVVAPQVEAVYDAVADSNRRT